MRASFGEVYGFSLVVADQPRWENDSGTYSKQIPGLRRRRYIQEPGVSDVVAPPQVEYSREDEPCKGSTTEFSKYRCATPAGLVFLHPFPWADAAARLTPGKRI